MGNNKFGEDSNLRSKRNRRNRNAEDFVHAEEEKALQKAIKMSLIENTAEDDFEVLEEIEEMKTFYPTKEEF